MSFDSMRQRIGYAGGSANDRIRKQKLRSFHAALEMDYNRRNAKLSDGSIWPCLFNVSNLKENYDKKYISIDKESGIEAGDTFELTDDNTHWMLYLQDLVEIAYIRSEIIRCRYTLTIGDNIYWVYFRGPEETAISWGLQNSISFNDLNLSGSIFIKDNEETRAFFNRFTIIKINNQNWEVKLKDFISTPGIIEVELKEYYENIAEELPEIVKETHLSADDVDIYQDVIIGASEIQQGKETGYTVVDVIYNEHNRWEVKNNSLVIIESVSDNQKICTVSIDEDAVGTFDICYGDYKRTITIDSAYSQIQGAKEVYPYETYEYSISAGNGIFSVSNKLAKIVDAKSGWCKVEIVSSKKGSFILFYDEDGSNDRYELPIKINSL